MKIKSSKADLELKDDKKMRRHYEEE